MNEQKIRMAITYSKNNSSLREELKKMGVYISSDYLMGICTTVVFYENPILMKAYFSRSFQNKIESNHEEIIVKHCGDNEIMFLSLVQSRVSRAFREMDGVELINYERQRQKSVEGFDDVHDSQYETNENLAVVAAIMSLPHHHPLRVIGEEDHYPFDERWLKVKCDDDVTKEQRIAELTKAGAMIAAQIDSIRRGES